MILREVQIVDFRQLTGENYIQFAQPGSRPLTVIVGENGAGKTTLLQALQWCLYGETDFVNEDELTSYKALAGVKPGESVETRVRLNFDANDRRYTAERTVEATVKGDGAVAYKTPKFHLQRTDPNGESKRCEDPLQEINRLLPKKLAGFFFFQGEDLEHLVRRSGAERLKSAVEEFVDLKLIDRAIRHLDQAEGKFEKELRKKATGESKELSDRIQAIDGQLEDATEARAESERQEKELLEQQEDVENRLSEYEELKAVVEHKRAVLRDIQSLEERIEEKEAELARAVSRNGFLRIGSDILSTGKELADELVDRGDLPGAVKSQLVDDLFTSGECICGTSLEEGERRALREWRASGESRDVEEAVRHFRYEIKSLNRRADESGEEFELKRDELAKLKARQLELGGERTRLEAELEGSNADNGEDTETLHNLLKDTNTKLRNVKFELGRHESKLAKLREEREELIKERDKQFEKEQEARIVSRRRGAALHAMKAFQKVRRGWIRMVQQYLDQELKRNWHEMAQLDRLVSFDEEFTLSIRERGADGRWVESAPSAANRRTLALGFVTSLIRLAAEAGASKDKGAMFFSGEKYPLVMDAPFATMDEYFKRTVPRGLRKIVPQLVVINSLDQWSGTVRDVLGESVDRIYVLELHGPEVEHKTFDLRGQTVDYKVREPTAEYDWTVVEEVEI